MPSHPAATPKMRAATLAILLIALALAGCTGLPRVSLRGSGGTEGGAGAEGGKDEPGLSGGVPLPPPDDGLDGLDGDGEGGEAPPGEEEDDPFAPDPQEEVRDALNQLGWLVHFPLETSAEDMQRLADEKGSRLVFAFRSLPIAYYLATEEQAERMAQDQRVVRVEREEPIEFHDAESRTAIRMPQVVDPLTGLRDGANRPIDGRGVGVAVVDTGIDALHPDLPYGPTTPGGVVAANYKIVSLQYVPLQDTDASAGHGTHVAAIVAGQGVVQAPVKGVAPGAKLYGLSIGEASTTVWSAQAFDWILQNYDAVEPPIQVVTNSWGTGGAYDPASTTSRFVDAIVAHGITVVFSAGNNGGDGSAAKTSAECQNPTPGVVCVAAYDDLGTGTRNGNVASYSSRGHTGTPSTWPDLSAPGTNVLSARPPIGSVTGLGWDLHYVQLSGTSQAAPHVAGVAALMLQRHPGLSPATVESTLEANAYRFTDGGAYATIGGHFAKGAGLVDAYASVAAV